MKNLIIDAGNTCIPCAAWGGRDQGPSLAKGSLTELAPPEATVLRHEQSHDVPVRSVMLGETILVRPGELDPGFRDRRVARRLRTGNVRGACGERRRRRN